jgi:Uncharacterised nucleotidyltransferase
MRHGSPPSSVERLGQALVELTKRPEVRRGDEQALCEGIAVGQLIDLACYHRVPGVVYRAMTTLDVDVSGHDLADLRAAYQMAAMGHGRCLLELHGMHEVLSGLGQPWLVVKGPVLVELGYGDPGARLYEDLDLLVAPRDLASALSSIEAAGGRVTDLNWPMMTELHRAEIPMMLPSRMLGDLHWHLLVTPGARARFAISIDELLERRRSVRIGDTEVDTLDVVDGLLYLCLHGSMSGGHQLVWLKDLDQMLAAEPPDWDELVLRARRYGTDLVAAVQLNRARRVLGAAVPETVIEALAGKATWLRLWEWSDSRVGLGRWGGYERTGRTVMSATSNGSRASVVRLMHSMVDDVIKPNLRARLRRSGGEEEDVALLYQAVGGDRQRAAYLEEVRTGAWD